MNPVNKIRFSTTNMLIVKNFRFYENTHIRKVAAINVFNVILVVLKVVIYIVVKVFFFFKKR